MYFSDAWYSFPTWCEEPTKSRKYSHDADSPSRSPTLSWQRLRQQRIQKSSQATDDSSPSKKRKLSVLNDGGSGSFPIILNVAGRVDPTEGSTDITDDSVLSGKEGQATPHEVIVVQRADDTESIQSSSHMSNTEFQSEIDIAMRDRLLDNEPGDVGRQTDLPENKLPGDKGRQSIHIKVEPEGAGNVTCSGRTSHNTSGYVHVSSVPVEEPEDLSTAPTVHSLPSSSLETSTVTTGSMISQNKPGPSGIYMAPHAPMSTLPPVLPCDQSTVADNDDTCAIKQEPPDDSYFSASGSGGEYGWYDSVASDSASAAARHSAMFIDPETVSNMSDTHGQGNIRHFFSSLVNVQLFISSQALLHDLPFSV